MVGLFDHPVYSSDLLATISRAAQVAQANLQEQSKQISRAIQVADLQNQSEQVSKAIQAFGQLGLGQSKAIQATRAAIVEQIGQLSKPVPKDLEQSRLEEVRKRFQTPELKGLRDGLESKELEIQNRLLGGPLELSRSSLELRLTSTDSILKQALDLRSDLESLKELPSSKPRQDPASPIAHSQALSLPQQEISQSPSRTVQKKSTLRANATSQKRVLIAIYWHLQHSQEQVIEWKPSAWFGKGTISQSARVGWCNALSKLIEKGLVERRDPDDWKFTHNRGNAEGPIALTPKGYQEAKWLIQND